MPTLHQTTKINLPLKTTRRQKNLFKRLPLPSKRLYPHKRQRPTIALFFLQTPRVSRSLSLCNLPAWERLFPFISKVNSKIPSLNKNFSFHFRHVRIREFRRIIHQFRLVLKRRPRLCNKLLKKQARNRQYRSLRKKYGSRDSYFTCI